MRAFEGQKSDNRPVKRNAAEKEAQLNQLKLRLAAMRDYESASLRASVEKKIAELEAKLGRPQKR
jgi:hypothetical protein